MLDVNNIDEHISFFITNDKKLRVFKNIKNKKYIFDAMDRVNNKMKESNIDYTKYNMENIEELAEEMEKTEENTKIMQDIAEFTDKEFISMCDIIKGDVQKCYTEYIPEEQREEMTIEDFKVLLGNTVLKEALKWLNEQPTENKNNEKK